MNIIIHLILLYQFVFDRGNGIPTDPKSSSKEKTPPCSTQQAQPLLLPIDNLKLGIIINGIISLDVNLKQTKRVLANENLPVWIENGKAQTASGVVKDHYVLERNNEVMKQLGEFTIYQQPETSSAAIYFHKRREFDGMIGYELLIQKLSVYNIHAERRTLITLGRFGVHSRPGYTGHNDAGVEKTEDPKAGLNDQKRMKTHGRRVYEGYPEVLVIVSWDVAQHWTQNVEDDDHYTTIVSQVLTLFNGVDMLYSKLKNTKIQINIAGIIIAKDERSLLFLQRCYRPLRLETGHIGHWMDGVCANSLLRLYLRNHMKEISLDSYDLAVFLTREDLFKTIVSVNDDQNSFFQHVVGVSSSIDELYECRKSREEIILVGSVTSKEYLDNYSTIAHEMAHLMTVKHDQSPSFTQDGECCGNLLRSVGQWCDKCLSWSETSEETFKLFFSSPNCCTFINKPRSLNPSGPQLILTADEQCQCYGYESAIKFREVFTYFCHMDLQCQGEDSEFHRTVIPMDGTSCHTKGVCWQRRCLDVKTIE